MTLAFLILLWFVCAFNGQAFGQIKNRPTVGLRAAGLGGAFVAVADDASAIHWNPAGLSKLRRSEFQVTQTNNLYGLGLDHLSVSFALPYKGAGIGISYAGITFDDGFPTSTDENSGLDGIIVPQRLASAKADVFSWSPSMLAIREEFLGPLSRLSQVGDPICELSARRNI